MCADSSEPSFDCKSWLRILTISRDTFAEKNDHGKQKKMLFHYLTGHSFGVSMFCESEPYRPC